MRFAVASFVLALSGCATAMSTASLENTYWKLQRAGGEAITVAEGQREPHVVLHGQRRALAGFTGCNRLGGSFAREGAAAVRFDASPLTRMACAGDAARHEQVLLAALSRAAAWRIAGERLDLLDREGAVVASFESVYLR